MLADVLSDRITFSAPEGSGFSASLQILQIQWDSLASLEICYLPHGALIADI